jgi:signal transduction histidine kinase
VPERKEKRTVDDRRSSKRGRYRAALLPAFLWAALLAMQVADHAEEVRRHRASLERAGAASLGMLEASLRSMGRGRRQRPEVLDMIFQEVAAVPGIRGTWLTDASGKIIHSKGAPHELPSPSSAPVALWTDGGLVVGRQVDIGSCPFDGQGRPRSQEEQDLPNHLFFQFDTAEIEREIANDLGLRAAIQFAAAIAACGGYLLLRARAGARRLQMDLAVSEARSLEHKEWALLGAGLAHETKNPLAAVRGVAQCLAEDEGLPAGTTERAKQIVDEVDRVVSRINEFLQFSRPVEPSEEPVALRPLFEEMARLIEADLAPIKGRLLIEGEALSASADPGMLRQILLNLLVNAARAIQDGGWIRLAALSGPHGTVTIAIEDNGRGIPEDLLDKVFEPYSTGFPGGIGLGLSIVKRLAEAHGWSVRLESRQGSGTRIEILGMRRASP